MVCGNAQGRPTSPSSSCPWALGVLGRVGHTSLAPDQTTRHVPATPRPTGKSVALCPATTYLLFVSRYPGPSSILALQLICEQGLKGRCSCTHPKTFLSFLLHIIASFRAKRISCMFPSSAITCHQPRACMISLNYRTAPVEKPLLFQARGTPFGPPACRVLVQ